MCILHNNNNNNNNNNNTNSKSKKTCTKRIIYVKDIRTIIKLLFMVIGTKSKTMRLEKGRNSVVKYVHRNRRFYQGFH